MHKNKGLSLPEILVVMFVIAMLVAIIIPNVKGSKRTARDAERVADIAKTATALSLYFDRHGRYPGEAGFCDSSKGVTAASCLGDNGDFWPTTLDGLIDLEREGFIAHLPLDPINDADYYYYYEPVCSENQFGASCPDNCCAYRIGAVLENTNHSDYAPDCMFGGVPHNYCAGNI